MDIILDIADIKFFTPYQIYPSNWSADYLPRQFVTLTLIVLVGGYLLYFTTAGLNYLIVFDKQLLKHPLILKNQIRREITVACTSVPLMTLLSVTCFLLEIRGYSKLYDFKPGAPISSSDLAFIALTLVAFILFTDCLIYWIHRGLHSKILYKNLHKTHHLWKVPTPFASHAFHPIDGFLQSLPYHVFVFLFPMHKFAYLAMFLAVNIWTVSIHDGDYRVPKMLTWFINGSAHHTDHHLLYNCNYGQFFTFWDRIGGSFKNPTAYQRKEI